MTITVNADCTSIELESTLIDDFVGDYTLDFTITLTDCDSNTYSYTVLEEDVTEGDPNILTITPELIISDDATEFPDGVFTVTLTLDDSGTLSTDVRCMLIDCDLECQVFDYQAENLTSKIFMYYQALQLGENCDNCNCSGMCALYTKIQDILGETTENDCGCS